MILDLLSFACPLLLASTGALFSEYAGILALYLDGLINFSAFTTYLFTTLTHSLFLGIILSLGIVLILSFVFSLIIEKTKANAFIASIGINLLFSSSVSLFSSLFFETRGTLTSSYFAFPSLQIKIYSLIFTVFIVTLAVCFLKFSQKGTYFRITGTNPDVLLVKGVNPGTYRIISWLISSFFACACGTVLALRISSYVPNISSGKGWMALAAVFLGKKKLWKIAVCVIIFCAVDFFSVNIHSLLPAMPTSLSLSMPYLIALLLIAVEKKEYSE